MSSALDSKSNQELPQAVKSPPPTLTQPSSRADQGSSLPQEPAQQQDSGSSPAPATASESSSSADGPLTDLHAHPIEFKYESILAGSSDPVEVWLPKSRYNAESKLWDKAVTSQYLLNTLSAVHKLIPHHLGVTYIAPINGEIDLAAYNPANRATHGQGNRFHILDNMDHTVETSAYTNSAKTPQQINLTRSSGGLPPLNRSNSFLENVLVNLYTSHPDSINPSHIDPRHAPFPVESHYITLSNLDVVPVKVHNEKVTTKATTPIDPHTLKPSGETKVRETTEKLPDTIAWARGTSVQRVVNTRNSGMLPDLLPGPHIEKLSPVHIAGTHVDATNEPTLVITNPLSLEKITLTGGAKSSPSDQLTQAEVNALSDMICIQRNRNIYRGNSYALAEDIINSLSAEIVDHVRRDLNNQYNDEYQSILDNKNDHKKSLDEALKAIQAEAQSAHDEKLQVVNAAVADLELQVKEAENRLTVASKEAGSASKFFVDELKNKIKGIESDLAKLRGEGKKLASQRTPDLDNLEKDFDKAKDRITQDYIKTIDDIDREWDRLASKLKKTEQDSTKRADVLANERDKLDKDFADSRKHIEDLSRRANDLLDAFKNAIKDHTNLQIERDNRINDANKQIKIMKDNFGKTVATKRSNIANQERVVDDLEGKIVIQHDLSQKRINEARHAIHAMDLEGCWEVPGGLVEVKTEVPVVETHYVKEVVEVPTIEEEYHWQVDIDPALKRETKAQLAARQKREAEERVRLEKELQEKAQQAQEAQEARRAAAQPKQNRGWFGSVADGARQWFAAQRELVANFTSPIALAGAEQDQQQQQQPQQTEQKETFLTSHSHIYDFVLNNYDSIIVSDTDDDEHGDSFQRWASLTDCDE